MFPVLVLVGIIGSSAPAAGIIGGDYLEVRSREIWKGPTGEPAPGETAFLGWSIREGSWAGEDLSGLAVAAAIRREAAPGARGEIRARSILFVDDRADDAAAKALAALARALAGKVLGEVIDVKRAPIVCRRDEEEARLTVKDFLTIRVRILPESDGDEGNAPAECPTLGTTERAAAAETRDALRGPRWIGPGRGDPALESAAVGQFSL